MSKEPTDREKCEGVRQYVGLRDNMPRSSAELFEQYGPNMPQTAQETIILQHFQEVAQEKGKSPECADLAATAVIDVARMKMLGNVACQKAPKALVDQIGYGLVSRARDWKPKVDKACNKPE